MTSTVINNSVFLSVAQHCKLKVSHVKQSIYLLAIQLYLFWNFSFGFFVPPFFSKDNMYVFQDLCSRREIKQIRRQRIRVIVYGFIFIILGTQHTLRRHQISKSQSFQPFLASLLLSLILLATCSSTCSSICWSGLDGKDWRKIERERKAGKNWEFLDASTSYAVSGTRYGLETDRTVGDPWRLKR